jgi:hypothetical protein
MALALALPGVAGATLPLGTQARVSTQGADGDPTFDGDNAAVAHNPRADQFLVVWEGDSTVAGEREVFGRLHTGDGSPLGAQFRISDMGAADGNVSFAARNPAVAYNRRADEYLVVWEGDDDSAPLVDGETEIFGQRLSAAGAEIGSNDFRISDMGPDGSPSFGAADPAVAYTPTANEFMVVWQGDDDTAPLADNEVEVFGQRLDASGSPIGANDARLSDMGPNGSVAFGAFRPAIAHNDQSDEYLVVWYGDDDTAPLVDDEYEVFAQRLNGTGAEIGPNDVRLSDMGPNGSTSFEARNPAIAHNGRSNEYLVVWQGDDDTAPLVDEETEIFGQRISADGAEIGTNDVRLSDMGPNGNPAFDAIEPAVAAGFRSNEYLVAWRGDDDIAPLIDEENEIFGQRVDSTGAETGANDFRVSQMGPDGDVNFRAMDPAVAYGPDRHEYMIAWEGESNAGALVAGEFEIYARRSGAAAAPSAPAPGCATVTPTAAPPGNPARVILSRTQLLINQRISQAAVNRANAIQAWFEAGLVQRDLCGGALTQADMGSGAILGFLADATPPATARPRMVVPKATGGGNPAGVTLSRNQLLINQRISQAAVRRANALKVRLDAGLSGGDVTNGALTRDALQFGLGILVATPVAAPPAKTVTTVAPPARGNPARVALSATQLLINQRISQAAVRRTNALRDRLATGLTTSDVKDGTITAVDFAASARF